MFILDLFRKKKSIDKAKVAGIREIPVIFGNNGISLRGKVLLPEEASVRNPVPGAVLCHGFGSGYRALEPSAKIMASQGVATIVFDFRGHGSSEGLVDGKMPQDVADAWETLAQFPEVDSDRMGLVGHSLGAMSSILAASDIYSPKMLISLSCPPELSPELVNEEPEKIGRWGHDEGSNFVEYPRQGAFPWLKGVAALLCRAWMYLGGFSVRVDWEMFIVNLPKLKMSHVLEKLDRCSKLFVFCDGDTVTPYQKSGVLYEIACEPKRLLLMKGGVHTTPLLPGTVRSQWTSWAVRTLMQS